MNGASVRQNDLQYSQWRKIPQYSSVQQLKIVQTFAKTDMALQASKAMTLACAAAAAELACRESEASTDINEIVLARADA